MGENFDGRIGGVARFGLFVTLNETGADGLLPVGTLPADFYDHDERSHALIGRRHGRAFQLGAPITVRLAAAQPLTGGLTFELVAGGSAHQDDRAVRSWSANSGAAPPITRPRGAQSGLTRRNLGERAGSADNRLADGPYHEDRGSVV